MTSTSHNYMFENMSRIGTDMCSLNQTDMQNVKTCNYLLSNYRANECNMKGPIHFATQQPNVNYTGPHSVGVGGCNVDQNSMLSIGQVQTNAPCKLSLLERPYLTVPYLGRGNVNVVEESMIMQGAQNSSRKSIVPLSEQSYMHYSQMPMLPDLQSTVTNPSYLIEEQASDGWIRGGVPCRELDRDKQM